MIGVDLFVLYDNGSTDGGADLIRRSSFDQECDADRLDRTRPARSRPIGFLCQSCRAFRLGAFIDLDEFIVPVSCDSIREA